MQSFFDDVVLRFVSNGLRLAPESFPLLLSMVSAEIESAEVADVLADPKDAKMGTQVTAESHFLDLCTGAKNEAQRTLAFRRKPAILSVCLMLCSGEAELRDPIYMANPLPLPPSLPPLDLGEDSVHVVEATAKLRIDTKKQSASLHPAPLYLNKITTATARLHSMVNTIASMSRVSYYCFVSVLTF